jgi:anti-anti-sigma factor
VTSFQSPEPLKIAEHIRGDGSTVLSVSGELDLGTVPALKDALDRLAAAKRRVVLDLRELMFMDSTGLHLIINAKRQADLDGWDFALAPQLSEAVAHLFDLTQLHGFMPLDKPDEP